MIDTNEHHIKSYISSSTQSRDHSLTLKESGTTQPLWSHQNAFQSFRLPDGKGPWHLPVIVWDSVDGKGQNHARECPDSQTVWIANIGAQIYAPACLV